MKKGLMFTAALAALTLGLAACGGGGGAPSVADITINKKENLQAEWFVGDANRPLDITIADGTPVADALFDGNLVVTSSNTSVVAVTSSGIDLKAVGAGKSTITATYKNAKSDSVEVEVKNRPTVRVVTTIDTTRTDYMLRWFIGDKALFAAGTKGEVDTGSPYYLDPTTQDKAAAVQVVEETEGVSGDYKYSIKLGTKFIGGKKDSSHINIGFSDEEGYSKKLFKFNSNYTFSTMFDTEEMFLAGYKGNNEKRLAFQKAAGLPDLAFARLVELGDPIPATSVTLDQQSLTLKDGQFKKLTATVEPANCTDMVEWESSDESKVKVVGGIVYALAEGSATVKAVCGQKFAECPVTVSGALNFGSETEPLSPEAAHDLIATEFADGTQTPHMMYAQGVVHSVVDSYEGDHTKITIKFDKSDETFEDKYFTAFGAEFGELARPEEGDTVVVKGYAKVYSGEYEICPGKAIGSTTNQNPQVIKVTPGEAPELTGVIVDPETASVNLHGKTEAQKVTLTASPDPARATLGEVSWTLDSASETAGVTVDKGVVTIPVDFVAAGGEAKTITVTATVTIEGGTANDTCAITVKNSDAVETYVVDFTAKTAKHSAYNDTWTYGDVTVSGGANNNGGWEYVKMGGKSATISAATYPGTYIKTDKAIDFAVSTVKLDLLGKCFNNDSEKAVIRIEAYSDATLSTKVAETASQEVPNIANAGAKDSLTFTFTTPTSGSLYYKVAIDITNTTTYNGVFCLEKITFSSAA